MGMKHAGCLLSAKVGTTPHRTLLLAYLVGLLLCGGLFGATAAGQASEAGLIIHADRGEQTISRYIYGHFAEHLGRCIYDGIWVGEDSPIPNTRGIRNDIVEALKQIKVPIVRWPGGCFADTYHWKDGIGPREDRPTTINRPGGGMKESNHFGTHEFMGFCEQVGCEPYFCGNVADGTAEEFAEWVEYTTSDGDSPIANLRRKNGRDKPWKIKYWAIGNEQGGRDYALTYLRFRPYLREYSGNKVYSVPSGPVGLDYHWTDLLLKMAGKHMDGLALHNYAWSGERSQSATDFEEDDWYFLLRRSFRMDEHLEKCIGIMDKYDPEKNIDLIVDEWGAWHEDPKAPNPHLCYQQNTLRDAMVAGIHFNIFHRHLDRIHMANIAQTVNVIQAMILTKGEKMLLTPTYHVFDMYKVHQDATYLPSELQCGTYTHEAAQTYTMSEESRDRPFLEELGPLYDIPALTATASRDHNSRIHISICNINPNKAATVSCEIRGADFKRVSGSILTAPRMNTHNTFDNPDAIKPAKFDNVIIKGNELVIKMPSKSIVALELD
jgi:alpha-N-arabinofuranosidase